MQYNKLLPLLAVTLSLTAGVALKQQAQATVPTDGLFSMTDLSVHGLLLADHEEEGDDHCGKGDHCGKEGDDHCGKDKDGDDHCGKDSGHDNCGNDKCGSEPSE